MFTSRLEEACSHVNVMCEDQQRTTVFDGVAYRDGPRMRDAVTK